MANQEHLERLKRGVEQWNAWRVQNQEIIPDLLDAFLRRIHLSGADLRGVYLSGAILDGADLRRVYLSDADLIGANLGGADLSEADLRGADLSGTDLRGANLRSANLRGARLNVAHLRGANLSEADLSGARISQTIFASIDLRKTKGLEAIQHVGPSIIQLHTVQLPQDGSAFHFLRGTGTPDEWIDFWRSTALSVIQYHSLFISYSSKDEVLARRLHADLQAQGVRCWYAPEDLKIGDKIRPCIDESIHLYDRLLLVLSRHSVASQWVEQEVETALEKERKEQRTVLFPIRLDNAVMDIKGGWPALIRNTRNIGDFTRWKEHDEYQKGLKRLLRNLKQVALHDTIESDAHKD